MRHAVLIFGLSTGFWLAGCGECEECEECQACACGEDADGDGYSAEQGDCDDGDASVYPRAEEICGDGIDQDCSGDPDDGFTDADGDGAIDVACSGGDDCDDTDPERYPDAEDICDGADNNCDGRIDEDTIVVPVPDSAKASADAMGFHLGVPVIEGIIRNRYVGRSFIKGVNRTDAVMQKYTPIRGALEGKRVLLVDDSIVRGNTVRRIIRDLKERGKAKEIHLRIACPPITRPCFYGIDMSTLGELFAVHFMDEPAEDVVDPDVLDTMARTMGAESLRYIPVSRVPECIGFSPSELCMACVTGEYPTPWGRRMLERAKVNRAKGITERTTGA